jgi:DUF4097 and DUF4098 domain-containing protein YvlB
MRKQRTRHVKSLNRAVWLAATLFLLAGPNWTWAQTVETIERSFTVDGVPEIYVRNVDGETRIIAREGQDVSVKAVKEVTKARSDAEAEKAASKVEVDIQQVGNRIEVETRYPKRYFSFGGPHVLVHIEVRAPRRSDMDIKSVDGNLEVDGYEGELDLETVDGDLHVAACSGRIQARSVDGDAELRDVVGSVDAGTVDGELQIDGNLKSLQAKSTDGDITVRVDPESVMEEDWSLRTSDGSIRVTLPEGFGVDLDIEADDGDIESAHPMTVEGKLSRHRFKGQLYGGGFQLRIRTSDGSVDLR